MAERMWEENVRVKCERRIDRPCLLLIITTNSRFVMISPNFQAIFTGTSLCNLWNNSGRLTSECIVFWQFIAVHLRYLSISRHEGIHQQSSSVRCDSLANDDLRLRSIREKHDDLQVIRLRLNNKFANLLKKKILLTASHILLAGVSTFYYLICHLFFSKSFRKLISHLGDIIGNSTLSERNFSRFLIVRTVVDL